MTIPKEYVPYEIESKWQNKWNESIYYFNWDEAECPQYIIDTPPPYPTGNFHIGNSLNWCYIDFIARYKRMRGYNVMFPQGWDCHGLPTEVKVEEIHGITKNQVPRSEFRRLCEELTSENIRKMRETMMMLGFSIDWSNEFITMDPSYYVKTQKSFVKMHDKGRIYQEQHPVNWCPRCETAIAFAEVEYESRQTYLNYLYFDDLKIATTRPELLAACVAVAINPSDERYNDFIGQNVKVPIFGHEVAVIADKDVDPSFGTGAVMICTFGDKQDVRWWVEHHLPLRKAIDKNGLMTEIAGNYAGMKISECKEAIIEDLKRQSLIYKQEQIEQNVGMCWRCKTPIEILSEKQWFVKINSEEILSTADEIDWIPEHMKIRLKNWTGTMEWDWCISRQRIFATPIPVWYCKRCGQTLVAKEEWLPLDPTQESAPQPCECGSTDFEAEEDVLDTWMDSSLTAIHVAGWLSEHEMRLPTQLRPQGHDIIRTWAFYTILRSVALTDTRPWDTILINGMVLGENGHKMSKSAGNIISPHEVVDTYGADAFRQWAAVGGTPGSDVMFRWKDVVSASRFLQKLWSIYRFSISHIENFNPETDHIPPESLPVVDRWMLSNLNRLIESTTESMDHFQFDETFKSIRGFTWEMVADNYIELVKSRLYGNDSEEKKAAQYTLHMVLNTLVRLLSPFVPFIAEEMYSRLSSGSVHLSTWPGVERKYIDENIEIQGELIKDIVASIRRYKSESGMALNAPLKKIEIYAPLEDTTDIRGATNSEVELISGKPDFEYVPVSVKPEMGIIGPRYRKKAGAIVKKLSLADPLEVAKEMESGKMILDVDGETIEVDPEAVSLEREVKSAGREVDVLDVNGSIVVIVK
ncbi:valyl-tRNA synthetase [Methanosalsum zhilinae DSM 4017]|uniref:Valine--tRNA ligase n=1 Tax=Methanosalsum zhilinae (strain DSM 4017 / NBRC 107636 / OCM 62 / WeN5) TaxID=679901 RepID=F7XKB5_METZD|nr:valine--tRNA ligase [Methanosalsum zhilinae]AEH60586.1 valyl-tRNA synthetase [Methanosalsum zhilinae DSM 4017]